MPTTTQNKQHAWMDKGSTPPITDGGHSANNMQPPHQHELSIEGWPCGLVLGDCLLHGRQACPLVLGVVYPAGHTKGTMHSRHLISRHCLVAEELAQDMLLDRLPPRGCATEVLVWVVAVTVVSELLERIPQ